MTSSPRRPSQAWRDLAFQAVPRVVEARGGAVVWPEVEGLLAHRDGWLAEHAPDLGAAKRIDPHHLGHARQLLLETGRLQRADAELSGRTVTAFLDGTAIADRHRTTVERAGATKRRLYRSFLGWTSDTRLCGQVAERHVAATLEHLAGRVVWLDPERGAGEVRTLASAPLPGGPLDHAGHVALDPVNPNAGFAPFLVEVKNVRQTLYPEHREIWDLLWKVGHYPDHIPMLIAPRFHHTTFVLFSAIGAIAVPTVRQWFAPDPAIATSRFQTVARGLAIGHAAQLTEPDKRSAALSNFFTKTLHKPTRRYPDRSLLVASRELWQRAAPICAKPAFRELREQLPSTHRPALYQQFLEELYAEGLEVEDLLPLHVIEEQGS